MVEEDRTEKARTEGKAAKRSRISCDTPGGQLKAVAGRGAALRSRRAVARLIEVELPDRRASSPAPPMKSR